MGIIADATCIGNDFVHPSWYIARFGSQRQNPPVVNHGLDGASAKAAVSKDTGVVGT